METITLCACSHPATFHCNCLLDKQYFCEKCIVAHIKIQGFSHNPIHISTDSRKEILAHLVKSLNSIAEHKTKLISWISAQVANICQFGTEKIKSLDNAAAEIREIIKELQENREEIAIRLRQTLEMDSFQAKEEAKTWKLLTFSFEPISITQLLDSAVKVENTIALNFSTPISIPDSTLLCNNGHQLNYSYVSSHIYFLQSKPWKICCNKCRKKPLRSSWTCPACEYDLCEDRGFTNGGIVFPLKCANNHTLEWRFNSNSNPRNSITSICSGCRSPLTDANWICSLCDYSICMNCAGVKLETPSKCLNNHYMTRRIGSIETKCSTCLTSCSILDACEACQYYNCDSCKRESMLIAGSPIVACFNKHLLQWGGSDHYACSGCLRPKTLKRFICADCNVHLCAECANMLVDFEYGKIQLVDQKRHNLEPKWITKEDTKKGCLVCVDCSKKFSITNCVTFACKSCNVLLCMNCSAIRKMNGNRNST
jgi:hypothetical protein